MLTRTFIHLPGIGPRTEFRLWWEGIEDWRAALEAGPPQGFGPRRWDELRRLVSECLRSLQIGEHRFFAASMPGRYHWRAWPDFRGRVAYLDIETTGTGPWAEVTVVGVYDGIRVHTFIYGDNLDLLPEFLEDFAVLVTYNGCCFDIPFLRRRFPGLVLHQLHFDLRYGLAAVGLRGGLKAIERQLGLARDEDIRELDGEDAVRLWNDYVRGDDAALDLLVRYNAADVVNLEPLAAYAYDELWRRTRAGLQARAR